jgi:anthranilate phosphoribosyltransferase
MKTKLNNLLNHQTLSYEEAHQTLIEIGNGLHNTSQIAGFLTAIAMRGITIDELLGFKTAMLELCLPVNLDDFDAMDVCGTGGDGKDTFNISTLACFVVAGAGQRVAKHGNHGVSSAVGSSTVLEYLGVKFTNDIDHLKQKIETAGVCYLHAPLFHPAMKHVAAIRKELGIKTFFNMLGPLINPSNPKKQLVGVFSLELARLYSYLYQQTDKKYLILHTLSGYDEISLTGDFKIITSQEEKIINPKSLKIDVLSPESLSGGDTLQDAADIFLNVLQNNATAAQAQVVVVNAAFALQAANPALGIFDAIAAAQESLESGRAWQCFKKLIDQ